MGWIEFEETTGTGRVIMYSIRPLY